LGVPISTGGVLAEGGLPHHYLTELIRLVAKFDPPDSDEDYVVDLAFRSWRDTSEVEFLGARPGMVGRTQRRVIVWHGVPLGLASDSAVRQWLADVLPDTARLLREWVPTKSKKYPAEQLAREVEALRTHLQEA
jgi:hypothetical protein